MHTDSHIPQVFRVAALHVWPHMFIVISSCLSVLLTGEYTYVDPVLYLLVVVSTYVALRSKALYALLSSCPSPLPFPGLPMEEPPGW